MYPRNAASPPRLAIGPVIQISDGAVQTSGVSVKVKPEGESASAGGGTTSYEEGIIAYVPTQAETDYVAFQVIAYKSGCIPAAVTVVTTAAATSGQVRLEGVTHTGATVPTVTTLTGHTAQSGDAFARLGAPSGASVSADVAAVKAETALIVEDTGTTLPATLATAQADLDILTGTDGATLATAQANYAPAKAGNQMDLVNAPNATAVTAIQNGLATPTNITAGTITTVTNLTNAPTNGDLTATMKASVTTAATAATPTAAAVTGAVGSVTGLTASDVGAIKAVTDKLDTTLVSDGAVYDFTAAALAAAPSGTGASAETIRIEMDTNSTKLAALQTGVNLTHIGGQSIDTNSATLKLKQLDIQNTDGSAILAKTTLTTGQFAGIECGGPKGVLAVATDQLAGVGISAIGGTYGFQAEGGNNGMFVWGATAALNTSVITQIAQGTRAQMDSDSTKLASILEDTAAMPDATAIQTAAEAAIAAKLPAGETEIAGANAIGDLPSNVGLHLADLLKFLFGREYFSIAGINYMANYPVCSFTPDSGPMTGSIEVRELWIRDEAYPGVRAVGEIYPTGWEPRSLTSLSYDSSVLYVYAYGVNAGTLTFSFVCSKRGAVSIDIRLPAGETDALVRNDLSLQQWHGGTTAVSVSGGLSLLDVQAAAEAAIDERLPTGATKIAGAGVIAGTLDEVAPVTKQIASITHNADGTINVVTFTDASTETYTYTDGLWTGVT